MSRDYVLVSPCKDEAAYLERTLITVRDQSEPPCLWIIVDDGSTDDSPDIIRRYMAEMPYIRLVPRESGARAVGGGVVRAFNQGFEAIDIAYDYVCKLDVDLELPPTYFAALMDKMEADPALGTGSGKAYNLVPGQSEPEMEICGDEASVGMTKFYRRACFDTIGGFEPDVGWDGYDCHRARWFGWRARSWDDPALRFMHLRPMGSSQTNVFKGRMRHGKGQYRIGTHPVFFCLSTAMRAVRQKPYLTGAFYQFVGYVRANFDGTNRFGDAAMTRFVRSYQKRALTQGKLRASEAALAERRAALGLPEASAPD